MIEKLKPFNLYSNLVSLFVNKFDKNNKHKRLKLALTFIVCLPTFFMKKSKHDNK